MIKVKDPLLILPGVTDQGNMDQNDFFNFQVPGSRINAGTSAMLSLSRR